MSRFARKLQAASKKISQPAPYPPSYGAAGSYKPDAARTGVPDGTVLNRYPATGTGDLTITTNGQVVDSLDVYGRIIVKAANVTIQRCNVRGASGYTGPIGYIDATNAACSNLHISDTTVAPDTPSEWTVGIDGHDWIADRVDLYNLQDCVRMRNNTSGVSNIILRRSWLHDLTYFIVDVSRSDTKQTHNDIIQIIGAVGAQIKGNFLNARYGPAGDAQPTVLEDPRPYGSLSTSVELAVMMHNVAGDGTKISGLIVEDNWIFGGYTPINTGDTGLSDANLGRYYRNRFDRAEKRGTPPITLRFQPTQTEDCGEGTVNCNVWDDDSAEVSVRRG